MILQFDNGYEVSIQHPSYNTFIEIGEVAILNDNEESMTIIHFSSGDKLSEILEEIANYNMKKI